MNDEEKYRLLGNYEFLVQNLKVNDIQDYLVEKFVITDEDSELLSNIARNETTNEAVRKLLVIIKKSKEPDCFKILCDALNSKGYDFIVDRIKKTDVGKIQAKVEREKKEKDDQVEKLNKQVWLQNEMMMQLKKELDCVREKVNAYDELEGKLRENGLTSKSFVQIMARYMENGGFSQPEPVMVQDSIPSQQDKSKGETSPRREPKLDESHSKKENPSEQSDFIEIIEAQMGRDILDKPYSAKKNSKPLSMARLIGKDIAFYLVAKKQNLKVHKAPNEIAEAMRRMVDDLIESHEEMFETTLRELDLEKYVGFQAIVSVFDELFREGETNWGRIVVLFAQGGYIAMNSGFNMDDRSSWCRISNIGDFLGYYVDEKLDTWIKEQGGWHGFTAWQKRSEFSWGTLLSSVGVLGAVGASVVLGIAALKS